MTAPYIIEAVGPTSTNAVRSNKHPILESGNLSFPNGKYTLEFEPQPDRTSFFITHKIEGAPLINRLLDKKFAKYGCIVSSPASGYRKTLLSTSSRQEIRWDVSDLGEPPLFTPIIVCSKKKVNLSLSIECHGIHEIWNKEVISLEKGARLAVGQVFQLQSTILNMLTIHDDKDLEKGQMSVQSQTEPFRFSVHVSTEVFNYLSHYRTELRNSIMTHIVTACLAHLQRDYSKGEDDPEDGWQRYRNLSALADYLRAKGHCHWSDDEFQPEAVATSLYPLRIPIGPNEDSVESEDE